MVSFNGSSSSGGSIFGNGAIQRVLINYQIEPLKLLSITK